MRAALLVTSSRTPGVPALDFAVFSAKARALIGCGQTGCPSSPVFTMATGTCFASATVIGVTFPNPCRC